MEDTYLIMRRQIINTVSNIDDPNILNNIVENLKKYKHTEDSMGFIWDLGLVEDEVIEEVYNYLLQTKMEKFDENENETETLKQETFLDDEEDDFDLYVDLDIEEEPNEEEEIYY